jgi:uncharacterized protein YkwD
MFMMKTILTFLIAGLPMLWLQAQDLTRWHKDTVAKANTAASVTYLTPEEKKVLLLMNLARMDGKGFVKNVLAPYVKEHGKSDNEYLSSLYTDLKKLPRLAPLLPNDRLSKSAAYHAKDMGITGMTGHDSSDGTECFVRIHKYVRRGYMGENCSYGYGDAVGIVLQLLIDDGIASLGHRKAILSPNFKRVGLSIKPHKVYRFNCVQDFAD